MLQLPTYIDGLTQDEQAALEELAAVWVEKHARNELRTRYYEGHNTLKDLKISIPPSLTSTETVVGWPAKAVDELAARSVFDGILAGAAEDDPFGLRPMLNANHFRSLYQRAVRAQLIHSVVFWTVSYGDKTLGEPPVIISVRSAEFAAATWDTRRKRIKAGIAITDTVSKPFEGVTPSEMTLYLDNATVILRLGDAGWTVNERIDHNFGRPLIEGMPFKPSEERPFGNSRISREVMSLTDSAQRSALRSEVLMEFNTAPQKYLLGANEDAFKDAKWKAYLDEILSISKDEDGDTPTFGQFAQLTPQGAIQYFQHLAERFSAATGIPAQSLGVITDNPSSADAMRQAERGLSGIAEELNIDNGVVIGDVARMALAVRDNLSWSQLPEEAWQLTGQFLSPDKPSIVSRADAMVKTIAALPWLADTTVALQEFGFTDGQIVRLQEEKRRAQAGSVLDRLSSMSTPSVQVEAGKVSVDDISEPAV